MKNTGEVILPVPFPMGVADPGAELAFMESIPVGIDGIDLATGRIVWHSHNVARPLLAHEGELVTLVPEPHQQNAFRIAIYRLLDRQPTLISETIELPSWVSVLTRAKDYFRYRVHVTGRTLHMEWSARSRYAGGAPPPEEIERSARKEEHGIVKVNIETGYASRHSLSKEIIPPEEALDASALNYKRSYTFQKGRWKAGKEIVSLTVSPKQGSGKALLTLSDLSRLDQNQEFEIDVSCTEIPIVSEDGYYVMVDKPPCQPPSVSESRGHELIRVKDAAKVLEFADTGDIEAFTVLRTRIFYTISEKPLGPKSVGAPRKLRARDLITGRILWDSERPTRRGLPDLLRP